MAKRSHDEIVKQELQDGLQPCDDRFSNARAQQCQALTVTNRYQEGFVITNLRALRVV